MSHRLYRCVRCFEKNGEKFLREIPVLGATLEQLQEIFATVPSDPMYDCFDIDSRHAALLEPYLPEKLDLENSTCFLECDSVEVTEDNN